MPVATASQLYATLGFTLPPARMNHDESIYLTWEEGRTKPLERLRIPVSNLRGELDMPEQERVDPKEQLGKRGFAVLKHESASLGGLGTEEGTAKYLDETADLLKRILDCDRVIAWNSVVRKNTTDTKEKIINKQQAPEKGFVPTSRVQPTAGLAHVDQNAEWGFELCGKAIGKPAGEFKRVQIINLWRPLHGPVTNAPLFMLDPTTLSPQDLGTHASQFGSGYDIHHSPSQRWAYIRHQMPDEAILLKCYDTDQGKGGEVLWCAHGAGEVDGDGLADEGEEERPRESVEVRLVAVWE
ncbi:hypothetical protein L202_01821 [Cryptococcus amylolentus CBS 6039]|uniref:Uncharacterized protein n=1 Tax=Cryptococcus amylolentus CBS 6039 TaxID=1295533 RepID=A0A1E3I549_9TREE|nr:hypothetical protein L202_01821 [Cryptococcus amylolentus CBS 6039]ODN83729.1 hypothetical protein L202_01821 [Cryptococcus amylolentus CBS 6039]